MDSTETELNLSLLFSSQFLNYLLGRKARLLEISQGMSLSCGFASEVDLSAQDNRTRENSEPFSGDARQIQSVPGSASSLPDSDKSVGVEVAANLSDSVYWKTCHQVLFFIFFFFFFSCVLVAGKMRNSAAGFHLLDELDEKWLKKNTS